MMQIGYRTLILILIIVKTTDFSRWFRGENDRHRYVKYFAIYFILWRLAITEVQES